MYKHNNKLYTQECYYKISSVKNNMRQSIIYEKEYAITLKLIILFNIYLCELYI